MRDRGSASGEVLDAVRGDATLLAASLRGFDPPGSSQAAHEALELLGSWTTLMLDAIEGQGGRAHQLTGDGIAAIFGLRETSSARGDAAWSAVQSSLEMRELVAQFNAERAAFGKAAIVLDIGIAGGEVVAGSAGTSQRAAHVCVGAAVHRSARLAALAAMHASGSTLIDGATQAALNGRVAVDSLAAVVLPGHAEAMPVHALKPAA